MNMSFTYGLVGVKYLYQFDNGTTMSYNDQYCVRLTNTKSTALPDGYVEMPIEEALTQIALGTMLMPDFASAKISALSRLFGKHENDAPKLVRVFVIA